ncbi:MAG: glycosyltransferase [Haloquadratum walsbyi J07HQW1]|uniref:Glycosyltransferase n=1 Tax=Haloquadratum walsbyi J07HQW1 TaxID=1238424 RepID=U1N6Q4_9EURY|nr:MAG: glycosyltransferase [Haloquadratum walsbyi J07HQW1]
MTLRVLNYLELESRLDRSGIGTAVDHQRAALELTDTADVEVYTSPQQAFSPRKWVTNTLWSSTSDADLIPDLGTCNNPNEQSSDRNSRSDPDRSAQSHADSTQTPVSVSAADTDTDTTIDTSDSAVSSEQAYDIIHCNLVGPGSVVVAQYALRSKIPLILHAHVTREDFAESFRGSTTVAPVVERYLKWFYSHADLLLCPSAYTRRILQAYPVEAPIQAITNGVDIESLSGFESYREHYRDRYDLSGTVVFGVGNVFERKGLTTFCQVAEQTSYDFAWFGPYDTGPQASRTVRRWTKNPPSNVTFTGWIDDIRGAYAAGDIYFFPTKNENQGIAVLEAMACGKAVVLRDIPVFEEFYTHNEDCLKCETQQEFRDAIHRLVNNPTLRSRLGENAKATAQDHNLERVGDRLVETYETVITAAEADREIPAADIR